jgi:hypothetical protein
MQKSAGSRQAHALPIYRRSLPVCGDTTMNMPWPSRTLLSRVEPFASGSQFVEIGRGVYRLHGYLPTAASVQCIALATSAFHQGEFHPGAVRL